MRRFLWVIIMIGIIVVSCTPSVEECDKMVDRGEYSKAVKGYEKILKGNYIKNPDVSLKLISLYETKDVSKAVDVAYRMFEEDSEYKDVYFNELKTLFDTLDAKGEYDSAKVVVEKIMQLEPDYINWKYVYIRLLVNTGKFEKSMSYIDTLEMMGEPKYRLDFYRGNIYMAMGNRKKAKEYYNKALKKKKDYLPAELSIAQMLVDERKLEEAKKIGEKLIEKYPDNPQVYRFMADLYLSSGDYDGSVKYIEKYNKLIKNKDVYKSQWYLDLEQ